MEQLIQITNVPIMIEMKTTMAQIQRKAQNVDLNISRSEGGGLKIKSSPIKVSIDTFEARNSIAPTTRRSIEQAAEKGHEVKTGQFPFAVNGRALAAGESAGFVKFVAVAPAAVDKGLFVVEVDEVHHLALVA